MCVLYSIRLTVMNYFHNVKYNCLRAFLLEMSKNKLKQADVIFLQSLSPANVSSTCKEVLGDGIVNIGRLVVLTYFIHYSLDLNKEDAIDTCLIIYESIHYKTLKYYGCYLYYQMLKWKFISCLRYLYTR